MCRRSLLCCLALTTGLFFLACGLTDNDLYSGQGSVSGTVEIDGKPTAFVQVNWVGAAFDSEPVITDQEGKFLLEGVEAGAREIMIRAVALEKGLRTAPVTVVDGRTSSIGTVQLEDAPELAIILLDPDLSIENAIVHLEEIPGVEAVTAINGRAVIPCVPRSGCYNPVTNHDLYTITFAPPTCPQTDQEWSSGLYLYPNQDPDLSQLLKRQQIHNAQVKIDKIYEEAAKCTDTCEVADWWRGPPCGLPVGREQDNPDGYTDLKYIIADLEGSDRYNDVGLNCTQIPSPMFSCSTNCVLESSAEVLEFELVDYGQKRKDCFIKFLDGYSQYLSKERDDPDMQDCLGIDPVGTDEIYVVYSPCSGDEHPVLKLVRTYEDPHSVVHLYYEIGWLPTKLTEEPSYCAWSLYRLSFQGVVPDAVIPSFSWIKPL
jgi:hypothetical protein